MATVYRLVPDVDRFQDLMAVDVAEGLKYRFDGRPIGSAWKPPLVYSPRPLLEEPDFWSCLGGYEPLAVAPGTARILTKFIDESCEPLPLLFEGRELIVLNVTYVLNCLNREKSRFTPGLPNSVEEYVFHGNRLGVSLFKIPETRVGEILCVEGVSAPQDEFKGTVELHGLKGLHFVKIWEGDAPR